ncbi:DUF92 domain-containing protein [Lewinella sp. W8]|uniref:DUF92 domain-containing protein n=1 Tax=Lewinella sp. W8 TaxID=2528208 RepID=UPI0010675121|nr:DUF92 domain-containing protein [Lewinella sp. W8]MTB49443.1 DUF92 domain-containing protein [Lewinella sp. W8]
MLLPLALTVLTATIFCEIAARREWIPYWISRKLLHIIAVGSCGLAARWIDRELLTLIVAGAEIGLIGLVASGKLMRDESGRKAWGIVWFPLAFLLLLTSSLPDDRVAFCMLVLALCDPAATIFGKLFARSNYSLTGDPKSLVGNLAFLGSFLVLALCWGMSPTPGLFLTGGLLAVTEALGSRGMDNLFVPLATAWLLGPVANVNGQQQTLLVTCLAAVVFAWWMVRRGSLTWGGAAAAALLGIAVTLSMGPLWLLPLVLFLGSSSLIGKFFPSQSAAGDHKHAQPRDAMQVFSNGAVYGYWAMKVQLFSGVIFIFARTPPEPMLLCAMAVATADTWSSELGQYFRQPTYDLLRWRRVPPGLSGGVSLAGTLAGLAGAGFIALCGSWMTGMDWGNVALFTLVGFLGMLLDSVLGALLQPTYRHPETGALSDVRPEGGTKISGLNWMTNDWVNFVAIAVTVFGYFWGTIFL